MGLTGNFLKMKLFLWINMQLYSEPTVLMVETWTSNTVFHLLVSSIQTHVEKSMIELEG